MSTALKKSKFRILLAAVLTAVLLFAVPALADGNLKLTLTCEPASMSAPGSTTVSIRVVNEGSDMTSPAALYDPAGQLVTSFGDGGQATIKGGEYVSCTQTYNVTAEQLDAGKLTYTLSYNDGQAIREVTGSADVTKVSDSAQLTVNRVVEPEIVRSGETVSVLYELANTGNVEINNIRIRENASISGTAQTVASLAAGERKTIKFTATMGYKEDMTSEGTVTYKSGDGTATISVPAVTILRAQPNLDTTDMLTVDATSVEIGQTVTLTFKLTNNGNITYSNIKVTDATLGEVFTNLTLNPGETLIREKQLTMNTSGTYKFTVTLPDNTGNTKTVTSNEVKVSAYNPAQVVRMTVSAVPSTYTLSRVPGDVSFTITVTNNSAKTAKNVTVKHGTVSVYTISSLEPGASVTFTRDFTLSQAGKYRFTVSCKDELGNTNTFESNEMNITYAKPTGEPTKAPVITVAPLVTVTAAPVEILDPVAAETTGYLDKAIMVLAGIFGVLFVLFFIATIVRSVRRGAKKKTIDSFDIDTPRDYTAKGDHSKDMPIRAAADEQENEPAPVAADDNGAYHLKRAPGEEEPDPSEVVYQRRSNRRTDAGEDE